MSIYQFNPDDAYRFAREQNAKVIQRGNELQFKICPYCKQATTKKYKFAINLTTGAFNCLRASCGAKGNMVTLAKDFGFSLGRDADEYFNQQRRFRDMSNYPRPEVRTPAVEYMANRGISKAITEQYAITTQKDHDNILVFPFFDDNRKMQFVKYRKADFDKTKDQSKEWAETGCKPILFGMDHCDPENRTLVMTEGQIDSMSVAEAGIRNAVSVPTGAKGFTWIPYCWDFLQKFDTLIVFGDHENGSITLLSEMAKRFHGTVKHVRPEDYKGCKDANEILTKYGIQAVRDAVANAEAVENPKILKMSEVERKSMKDIECITTGFKRLDRTIGGFFMGHLVLLTGKRGQGKSTLASQFGTWAMNSGYNTFFYSGELMDWFVQDWIDRQCAGPSGIYTETTALGYTTHVTRNSVSDRIHAWYDNRCYLYNNKSIMRDGEDEDESLIRTMESAIKQYGCRVLIIDNLMTAMDDDLSLDLYRQQTKFVNTLVEMAKAFEVLIILIAHPRKMVGDKYENDDIFGSSTITNLASITLSYGMPPKPGKNDPPPAEDAPDRVLSVIKNRIDGRTCKIDLWYEEKSKRISENGFFNWQLGWEVEDEWTDDNEHGEIPF